MNLDFSDDVKLLQKTARDYLAEHSPLSAARAVLESTQAYDERLWTGIAQMGWLGAAVPEELGGAGLGHLALTTLAEELGRALSPIPFSSSVYLAMEALLLAGTAEQKRAHLPRLASGELIGTLAVTEGPGHGGAAAIETTYAAGRVTGTKVCVPDGIVAGLAIVAAREPGGSPCLVAVDLPGARSERVAMESIDPTRSLARLVFDGTPGARLGEPGHGTALMERVFDRAAVLLAFEQLGGAARALEITGAYAMGRYVFGRPIASFQALKHRLADLWAAVELARSNCFYGAWALHTDSPELPIAAAAARVSATAAYERAVREMIQMHGGAGFTWEYDCHLFYRRSKLLALTLGPVHQWRERLVHHLQADTGRTA
jgi:alkylation response protein AidB-like acyl-CoA dehydrogenase